MSLLASVAGEGVRYAGRTNRLTSSRGAVGGGGRRRREAEAAAETGGPEDRGFLGLQYTLGEKLAAKRAELTALKAEFEHEKAKLGADNVPRMFLEGLKETYEDKAAGIRKEINSLESDLSQRVQRHKAATKVDGPGSTAWRRYARDYRRQGRAMRYARQGARSRFNQSQALRRRNKYRR